MSKSTLTNCIYSITDLEQTKEKVLNWLKQFDTFCFLDSNRYGKHPGAIECIAAAGVKRGISAQSGNALRKLQDLINEKDGWLFGHLCYDLKNEIEKLSSGLPDQIGFPDLYFFEPLVVVRISSTQLIIDADDPGSRYENIMSAEPVSSSRFKVPVIQSRITKDDYLGIIAKLRHHIHRGDCFEINFCQEFYADDVSLDPLTVFKDLCAVSPNPFSCLYRLHDQWLVCASPERFLEKKGDRIISQPIKGTASRNLQNSEEDLRLMEELSRSSKDRAENVMVVDLVRNDLSKVCRAGTVQVEELFGIYSFPQVHQMISTVSGTLREQISFSDIIRACFPMGSMTGAPKKKVMELIEKYERTRRGLFSGSVGYIEPGGDFDFNVVIRSILYNEASRYLSFQAGGGITFYSDPEKEWDECQLKAAAIKKVLEK